MADLLDMADAALFATETEVEFPASQERMTALT